MEISFFKNKIMHLTVFLCVLSSTMQADESAREAEIRKIYEDTAQTYGIVPDIYFVDADSVPEDYRYHILRGDKNWMLNDNKTIFINTNLLNIYGVDHYRAADDLFFRASVSLKQPEKSAEYNYQEDAHTTITRMTELEQEAPNTQLKAEIKEQAPLREPIIRKIYEDAAYKAGIPQADIPTIIFVDEESNSLVIDSTLSERNKQHINLKNKSWITDDIIWINKNFLLQPDEEFLKNAHAIMSRTKTWLAQAHRRDEVKKIYEDAARTIGVPESEIPNIIFVDEYNVAPEALAGIQRGFFAWTDDKTVSIYTKFLDRSNVFHRGLALHEMTHVKNHDNHTIDCAHADEKPIHRKMVEWRADLAACDAMACEDCILECSREKDNCHLTPTGYLTTHDRLEAAKTYAGRKCDYHKSWAATLDRYMKMVKEKLYGTDNETRNEQ